MVNLFLNFIYSLTTGSNSVISRVKNFLGAEVMQTLGTSMSTGWAAIKNFVHLVFWEIEKFILGVLSALEFIAYEFLGIGKNIDDYGKFAEQNNITRSYTRTFKGIVVVAIILMIVFTLFAIVRQEWVAFQAKGSMSPKNNNKIPIVMRLFRGIMTIIALPITVIIIFGGVNSVLTAFNRALQGKNASTIATNVLATASYNSNRFTLYVEQNKRVPIVIQAYNTSEYKADEKDELVFKIKSPDVQTKLKSTAQDLANNTFISFKESLTFSNNKLTNSSKYGDFYESFVCTPEQYLVLADFVNYAELTQQNFYIRAVDDDMVDWKYVDSTVFNATEKSLTISYRDATKLTENNNGLNTASAASSSNNNNDKSYTITYSLGYDISSPISDAYETMQALLGIGKYSDVLYNKLEREEDSVNVVHWATKKVSIHFSKYFVRDNPQTWTPSDEILMYEYYHYAVNNTFDKYTIDDLSYQKCVVENKPVTLDAKIYTYRKYYPEADAYSPEINVDCVYINGSYYITELSKTETDEFGNSYYVLKNLEDANFLTKTYVTAFIADAKKYGEANIKLSQGFNLNDPYTWSYSDQIIVYEYYKDLSYNNNLSKYRISDFSGEGVKFPVYVISLHENLEDTAGSPQFYALINDVYYQLSQEGNNFTLYSPYNPVSYYKLKIVETNEIVLVESSKYSESSYPTSKYEVIENDFKANDITKQFFKEINSGDDYNTYYKYSIQLDKPAADSFGISTEKTGMTADDFIIANTNNAASDKTYYYFGESKQTPVTEEREVYILDNGKYKLDKDGNPIKEKVSVQITTEKAPLLSTTDISNALQFDDFENYTSFDLRFSNTFDYKDVNTWNYRDYFIFYLYSKYLASSGITLNQLKIRGGLKGEICRVGIGINAEKYSVGSEVTKAVYDRDDCNNPVSFEGEVIERDAETKAPLKSAPVITEYLYVYRIDPILTGGDVVYLKIDDVMNISEMNILNKLNLDSTFNANNFDKAYEQNLFIDLDIDLDSETQFEFSFAETSSKLFSFSRDFVYDSQGTWTVGDFILLYLNQVEEAFTIPGINGSFIDMDNVLKEYPGFSALCYTSGDKKDKFYQFGTGNSAIYLNERYVTNSLNYISIDSWWNTRLFDFITKNSNGGSSNSGVIANDQTIVDKLYQTYAQNVKNKDNLISLLVENYILKIDSNTPLFKNIATYNYYNPDFDVNKYETWTVLDGILNKVLGGVSRKSYEFKAAFQYNESRKTDTLYLMINDKYAIELSAINKEKIGLEYVDRYQNQISSKLTNYSNASNSYNQKFGLINDANIVSRTNLSSFVKDSAYTYSYSFAANSTSLTKLDCLLIELYNTTAKDVNGNDVVYKNLEKVSHATYANRNTTFNFEIYSLANGSSSDKYLYLGNIGDKSYFYVFDPNKTSSTCVSSISDKISLTCSKKLFTLSNDEISFPSQTFDDNVITNNDEYSLLDAIILNYEDRLQDKTFKKYVSGSKSYIIVNGDFIELNDITNTKYKVDNLVSSPDEKDKLIKTIYELNYKKYYEQNSPVSSDYTSSSVNLTASQYKDDENNIYKNEIKQFRLNDMKTWTPLNIIFYNLGLINNDGVLANDIRETKIYEKNNDKYLRVTKGLVNYDINIMSIASSGNVLISQKPQMILMYFKNSTIEVFLRALYILNKDNAEQWLTFDNIIEGYTSNLKTIEELNLLQTTSVSMNFNDLSTWDWYSLIYYYYNKELPSSEQSYYTYGKNDDSKGFVAIPTKNGNLYFNYKVKDNIYLFNNLGDSLFTDYNDSSLNNKFTTSYIDTSSGKTNYSFGYNMKENNVSSFGIINYKLTGRNEGNVTAYKFYDNNKIFYYLNSANTFITELENTKIEVSSNDSVKYSGKMINSKTMSELSDFDLYVKYLNANLTEDSNRVVYFGGDKYLELNNQYINLDLLNVDIETNNGVSTLKIPENSKVINKFGINKKDKTELLVSEANKPADLAKISSNLPTLPGMESGSTIIKLKFTSGFDFSNYSTWKLSDFLLYYIFVENNFNYSNNKEEAIENFQHFVNQGYVESTFCNLKVMDESGNISSYNVLLIGQAVETNMFNDILNNSPEDVSKYVIVDYSIFYELFNKNLMNISTYSYSQTSAPLSIDNVGSSVNSETTTIKKFGVSFTSSITTEDFKFNNYYYFDVDQSTIDEFMFNYGITKDTNLEKNDGASILIDLKLSQGFNISEPSTWTILDYIILYEYSRNINNNVFEGLPYSDLTKGFLIELDNDGTKFILNINGNRYDLTKYVDQDAQSVVVDENLCLAILNSKLKEGETPKKMEDITKDDMTAIKVVDITDKANDGYNLKILHETRRFNILIDVRDVTSELENTLISGAAVSYYKLKDLSTNEEIYISKDLYSEEKYDKDNYEILDDNYSINDTISRSAFINNYKIKGLNSSDGSGPEQANEPSHKRIELIKTATTLLYNSKDNNISWLTRDNPIILNDYYKFENEESKEIVFAHRSEVGTDESSQFVHISGNNYKKDGISFIKLNDPDPTPDEANLQSKTEATYYRNLDKNLYFNYQISLTRYKNYVISTNIQKVNWPQKLLNDMMVIYPDLNWETLLATDGWIDTLGDYHSGTSSGQYIIDGNSANITAVGMVLSEFLLSIATEPTSLNSYANFQYESIYDSKTIKAVMLSILGEEEYDSLVNEANIFVDLFNTGFAGILDDIAAERNIQIKEGKVDGFEMSIYKSYLSTAILSSDFAEYLYTVATRVLAQYTIYEPLARAADDYDSYYAYFTKQVDSDGELIDKFTYGSFRELVEYENQSLKKDVVPMFTFNFKTVSSAYEAYVRSQHPLWTEFLELLGITDFINYLLGRDGWGEMLDWYEDYYEKIYLENNSSVSQDDPMYCFMFDVYYSIRQSIKKQGLKVVPTYLELYKDYIDGDKNTTFGATLKRWDIIKDVSIDGASVFLPSYSKYKLMLQLYKAKAMVSYLDFMLMPLYSPLDAIGDLVGTATDIVGAAADIYGDVAEMVIDVTKEAAGMAIDFERMKLDVMFNQDDLGDRAESIGNHAVEMANSVKDTALDIADTITETAEKIGDRAADAMSAILSVNGALTVYRVFADNEIYNEYYNYIVNPKNSFIFPYLKSEGTLYALPDSLGGGSAGVVEGWNQINELYRVLGLLMEEFATLEEIPEGKSSGAAYRYVGLRKNVIEEVFTKLSDWHDNVGSYINMQSILDKVSKGSITFTLAQFTNNYKEEGYSFNIQNKSYKMKTAVSAQRIGEYVYGGAFLESFGIPASYTTDTFTGLVKVSTAYDTETNGPKKAIKSFATLREFSSQLANYTGKLYLLSNVMDLSATNEDNPIDPTINNFDSIKMTDYIYAANPLKGKQYNNVASYILTTQEYLLIDYMIQNNYLSYDTLRSLLVIDNEENLAKSGNELIKSLSTSIDFNALNDNEKTHALDNLRYYLAYVQSDNYQGEYNTDNINSGRDRVHTIFKKVVLYLTNKVEDNSNGYDTEYEGEALSFDNMYFQKLRLIFIEALTNFVKNDTDSGEDNSNRYLSLYNLANSEFNYYYYENQGNKYGVEGIDESKEKLIGRNVLCINNTLVVKGKGEDESTQVVEYISDKITYSARASFKVDTTSDGLFKKLAGIEHRPVEELVNRQYNNLYARNGYYDEQIGDTFILCTYDPVFSKYYPILARGPEYEYTTAYDEIINSELNDQDHTIPVTFIDTDYVRGKKATPIIAKGPVLDGINGFAPTAIKMVNGEVSFYRDSVTVTGDLNDSVASGVVITEVSTSKYIKYVGSSSFSKFGDSHTMYIGANNPVAYIESNASVYYIQYTTNYSVETEDAFGAISVLAQFPNFYSFDTVFHLLMLLGFVTMIPIVFKAILLGMRRMLDLMALILLSPLAIATNSLQIDDKGNNKIYEEWKRMFTASLLSVFGIVVSFNLYYILVNTALHMTFITPGDATMTIIEDSPLNFITANFLNALIKFFFIIVASSLVESGGKLIGKIITGNRVSNSYASQISNTEPLQDMAKIKGDLTKAANFAKKLYSGELLQEAMAAAVEVAKESVPGSAIIRKAMDNRAGKKDMKAARNMAAAAKNSGANKQEANRLANKYLQNATKIRSKKREDAIKKAKAFQETTGIGLPIAAEAQDFNNTKKHAKRQARLEQEFKNEAKELEKQQKEQEKKKMKKMKKLQKVEELHSKGKLTRKEKFKNSVDRLDKDIRENGFGKGVKKWVKDGVGNVVNTAKAKVHKAKESVKNAAIKSWKTLKGLPKNIWKGIKTGAIKTGQAFKKAGISAVALAKKFPGAMKKLGGKIKTGVTKAGKAVGRGFVKAGKAVGRGFRKAGQKTVQFFKNFGPNMRKIGGKIKEGITKTGLAIGRGVKKATFATGRAFKKAALKTADLAKKFPGAMKKAAGKVKTGLTKAGKTIARKTVGAVKKGVNFTKKKMKAVKSKVKQALSETIFGRAFTLAKKGTNKVKYGVNRVRKVGHIMKDSADMQSRAQQRYEAEKQNNNNGN